MLSCMAAKLYWLARYVDLADFLAQNIKTSQRHLPASYSRTGTELECVLGTAQVFRATCGNAEEARVVD